MVLRVLITGPQDWDDWDLIETLLSPYIGDRGVMVLVTDQRGVGKMTQHKCRSWGIPVSSFLTDWEHGRRAPHIRDVYMLDQEPDIIHVLRYEDEDDKYLDAFEALCKTAGYRLTKTFGTPKTRSKDMNAQLLAQLKDDLTPEQLQKVIEAFAEDKAAQKQAAYENPSDEFSATQKDVEGNPLKLTGTGVRPIQRLSTCNRCGSGNVAWVKSRTSVYPDVYKPNHPKAGQPHPKAGQPTDYLVQAYTEGKRIVALAWQLHSDYCDPTGAATHEDAPKDDTQVSIDDAVEADRSEPKPFDGFSNTEVNEVGDDIGTGFLAPLDSDKEVK